MKIEGNVVRKGEEGLSQKIVSAKDPEPILLNIAIDMVDKGKANELIKYLNLSKEYHKGQEYGNRPFRFHPQGVALNVLEETIGKYGLDFALYCARLAFVHDIVEKIKSHKNLKEFEKQVDKRVLRDLEYLTFSKDPYIPQIINITNLPLPEFLPVPYVKRADIRFHKLHPPLRKPEKVYNIAENLLTERIDEYEQKIKKMDNPEKAINPNLYIRLFL